MLKIFLNKCYNNSFTFNQYKLINLSAKYFTGKTETGYKFTTPKMQMKSVVPVFPPPGYSLQIPSN